MTSSGQNDDATRFTKMVKIAQKHAKIFSGASHSLQYSPKQMAKEYILLATFPDAGSALSATW
jgi:hypothetical protein